MLSTPFQQFAGKDVITNDTLIVPENFPQGINIPYTLPAPAGTPRKRRKEET